MKQVLSYACQKSSFLTYTSLIPSEKKESTYPFRSAVVTTASTFNAAERFAINLTGGRNA